MQMFSSLMWAPCPHRREAADQIAPSPQNPVTRNVSKLTQRGDVQVGTELRGLTAEGINWGSQWGLWVKIKASSYSRQTAGKHQAPPASPSLLSQPHQEFPHGMGTGLFEADLTWCGLRQEMGFFPAQGTRAWGKLGAWWCLWGLEIKRHQPGKSRSHQLCWWEKLILPSRPICTRFFSETLDHKDN